MNKKGSQAKKRIKAKTIKKLTHGLFSTVTDATLFTLFLIGSSFGKKANSRDVHRTFNETGEILSQINYKTIKKTLYRLREQGLIESIKSWTLEPIITQNGLKRLKSLTSVYDEKRVWDGHLYLINYDVKTTHNSQRKTLRELLKKIGAFKLQNSLYLTPYNPAKIINNFLEQNLFEGVILISHLGKKGFLGKNNLQKFIWESANLEKVNNRYQNFINKYKNKNLPLKTQVALDYYAILKDDPQLPFKLLKDEYLGDKAYLLFLKLTKFKTP